MLRAFIAIGLLCVSSGTDAQSLEFEATPNDSVWPPAEDVSFEELCRSASRFFEGGYSRRAACTVSRREGEHVVVSLRMGIWHELILVARVGRRYRFVGTVDATTSQGNHQHDASVLRMRPRTYQGQTYVFLQMRHEWADYYGNGSHQCFNEYLLICSPRAASTDDRCTTRIGTRQECDSQPPGNPRTESSWWQVRHLASASIARASIEVSDEGLLHVVLQSGTWERLLGWRTGEVPEGNTQVLRFAPPPPLPEAPPFIEGTCRQARDGVPCDDRLSTDRYPVSLETHADFQALCDDAHASSLDVTGCSEERITRTLSIVRTRRGDDAGPTFVAERGGTGIRLISRMSEPYPQPSALRFIRRVRGPGRYYGIEFEERMQDAMGTTRRHLLVCQRSRERPRCSLRVPLRFLARRARGGGDDPRLLQVQHFAEAHAEIRRDGTLVLTRAHGSWEELFGIERAPAEENERVIYRL